MLKLVAEAARKVALLHSYRNLLVILLGLFSRLWCCNSSHSFWPAFCCRWHANSHRRFILRAVRVSALLRVFLRWSFVASNFRLCLKSAAVLFIPWSRSIYCGFSACSVESAHTSAITRARTNTANANSSAILCDTNISQAVFLLSRKLGSSCY